MFDLFYKFQSFVEEHSTVIPIEDIWRYHNDNQEQEHHDQGSFHFAISTFGCLS